MCAALDPPAAGGELDGPLVCPQTKLRLRECALAEATAAITPSGPLAAREPAGSPPVGPTPRLLLREDGRAAYPILDDVPALLGPELLAAPGATRELDRDDPRFAEAYDEMAYYNPVALEWARELRAKAEEDGPVDAASDHPADQGAQLVALARGGLDGLARSFPDPAETWIHLRYDGVALRDAYAHLAPLGGKRVLQIGGIGLDGVKFLLAGAAEVWLVSPMTGELEYAATLARACHLEPRLHRVLGVAEELPFADESFDAVFAGGSIHHTTTSLAFSECVRVLRHGGRFASAEPWRSPGYGIGTRIFGKREPVGCRPLTRERIVPLFDLFEDAEVIHHGTFSRYIAIALGRCGVHLSTATVRRLTDLDDRLTGLAPPLRRAGSSVALIATRA